MIRAEDISEAVWRVAMMTYHREIRRNPEQAWQLAIAAAVTTWPGVLHEQQEYGDPDLIILPLTQSTTENDNA